MSPFAKILGLVWVAVLFAVVLLALVGGAMLVVFLIAAGVCLGIVFVLWQALRQPQLPPASRWWVLITRKMRAIAGFPSFRQRLAGGLIARKMRAIAERGKMRAIAEELSP